MKKLKKEIWLKSFILVCLMIITASIFYYFVIFIPNNERKKIEDKKYDRLSKIEQEYNTWKEDKMAQDIKLIEKELSERWKDVDTEFFDKEPYRGTCEEGEKKWVSASGEIFAMDCGPGLIQKIRDSEINIFIEKETDENIRNAIREIGDSHPKWLAYDVSLIANKQIIEGMDSEMVEMAWRKPDNKVTRTDYTAWWYWSNETNGLKGRDLLVFNKHGKLILLYRDL